MEQDGWMAQCCSSLAEQLRTSQAAHVDMEAELACLREALASAQAQARGPQNLALSTHPLVPALTLSFGGQLSSWMLKTLLCATRAYGGEGGCIQSAHWHCLLLWYASRACCCRRGDPACAEPQARVAASRDEGWLEACCASLAQELRAAQDDNAALQQELDAARAAAANLPPGPRAMSMSSGGASSEASSADASPMAWRGGAAGRGGAGEGGAGEGEVEALRAELAVRMPASS